MMMGAGLLFMLLILVIVIGIPLLLVVLITGGGLAALLKSLSGNSQPPVSPASPVPTPTPAHKCPTCGREIRPGWNVCPSCGAVLT